MLMRCLSANLCTTALTVIASGSGCARHACQHALVVVDPGAFAEHFARLHAHCALNLLCNFLSSCRMCHPAGHDRHFGDGPFRAGAGATR
jgi:hypothetical protein